MSKNYTTDTASLKATIADIRRLNGKEISLNGKNILDYISDSEFNSYDTRDPQLKNDELDIWNTKISLSDNGHIEVKPHVHSILLDFDTYETTLEGITESQYRTLETAVKIIDNEVLGANDEHIMYWQTDGLTRGDGLFIENTAGVSWEEFNSDLSNLESGYLMFVCSPSLTSFSSNLPNLIDGTYMFEHCHYLQSFDVDLPNLTIGDNMFFNCDKLTSFTGDLSKLISGKEMFYHLNQYTTKMVTFNSDLSSLKDGTHMFTFCKLDAKSVANIVHSLPTHETGGVISIGIGCNITEADKLLFAQECDCETWQELLDDFSAKNWTVAFQCTGRPTEAATYGMRRGETLPIYTKLEEVIMPTDEKKHKPHYAYTSADGSKFFNINCFHSTNGSTEGYDVFSSLEEAISTYNVTPKN